MSLSQVQYNVKMSDIDQHAATVRASLDTLKTKLSELTPLDSGIDSGAIRAITNLLLDLWTEINSDSELMNYIEDLGKFKEDNVAFDKDLDAISLAARIVKDTSSLGDMLPQANVMRQMRSSLEDIRNRKKIKISAELLRSAKPENEENQYVRTLVTALLIEIAFVMDLVVDKFLELTNCTLNRR